MNICFLFFKLISLQQWHELTKHEREASELNVIIVQSDGAELSLVCNRVAFFSDKKLKSVQTCYTHFNSILLYSNIRPCACRCRVTARGSARTTDTTTQVLSVAIALMLWWKGNPIPLKWLNSGTALGTQVCLTNSNIVV